MSVRGLGRIFLCVSLGHLLYFVWLTLVGFKYHALSDDNGIKPRGNNCI